MVHGGVPIDAIILHWHTETHQVASTGLEGTVGLVHLITKLDDN